MLGSAQYGYFADDDRGFAQLETEDATFMPLSCRFGASEAVPCFEKAYLADPLPASGTIQTYFDLQEIQQPRQGRKCATVDRRPIDPPPVVKLRVFEAMASRSGVNYAVHREVKNTIDTPGYVCVAYLYAARRPCVVHASPPCLDPFHLPSMSGSTYNTNIWNGYDGPMAPPQHPNLPHPADKDYSSHLVGSRVATSSTIVLDGEPALVFAFPDLSVSCNGAFYLQYRLFDLAALVPIPGFSRPAAECQAACVGGTFTVYPSKGAPCLPPSTRITKALRKAGIKVTYRTRARPPRGGKGALPEDNSSQD